MQTKYPKLKGTIFIVTYGRSGSTLLQSLLQSIPNAHIMGENTNVLESLFRASVRARKTRKAWGNKPQAASHPWHGADRIFPNRFEKRLARTFTEEILQPPTDAHWIGFKEIRYPALGDDFPAFLNFCRRGFHNAFFVFNSRNGEDVARSKWWARKPREDVLDLVNQMDERFADFADRNPEFSHHVRHEQTIANPATLQPLFDKLGESLDIAAAETILGERLTH